MPIKKSDYLKITREVVVTTAEGDKLTAKYRPAKINGMTLTPDLDANSFLVAVVAEWDYLGDDDLPVPITAEEIAELPIEIQTGLMNAILHSVNPTLTGG